MHVKIHDYGSLPRSLGVLGSQIWPCRGVNAVRTAANISLFRYPPFVSNSKRHTFRRRCNPDFWPPFYQRHVDLMQLLIFEPEDQLGLQTRCLTKFNDRAGQACAFTTLSGASAG
jgi:hypothetical protein